MWVIISNVYYLSICNLKRIYINNRWWCWESQKVVLLSPYLHYNVLFKYYIIR